jgi:hypothetical protein
MRLPRVRFTVRRMMVAVAIVALLAGVGRAYHRHVRFKEIAFEHDFKAHPFHCGMAIPDESNIAEWKEWRERRNRESKMETYHAQMFDKYERAARLPWLFVEPDPPEPKCIPSGASGEL